MTIEYISIATEVLSGFTINTNAAFISRELFKKGLTVARHTVVPDESTALKQRLQEALKRSKLVIVTGGLGPTLDDVTRAIAADLFQTGFHFDEQVAEDLKRRYGELSTLVDQATVPVGAEVLLNSVGTAPGLILTSSTSTLILMPGVPMEMKPMMVNQVLPRVEKMFQESRHIHQKSLNLFGLPEAVVDPVLRELKAQYPEVGYGIYPGQGTLTVHLDCFTRNSVDAEKGLKIPYETLRQRFSEYLFESPDGKIEDAVHHAFLEKGATLVLAESCTGGAIATHLTQRPGASGYFLGSLVCYSNELKTKVLGVPESVIKDHGAVSQETALWMALGAQKVSGSDYALAVTGLAGPGGGSTEKPVGTVYGAIAKKDGSVLDVPLFIPRSREIIIERAKNVLLSELLKLVR